MAETLSITRLDAWLAFLRSHAAITREMSVQLQREHGLTLNDYEVLLHLEQAEGRRLRRVDLAERVLLTASGSPGCSRARARGLRGEGHLRLGRASRTRTSPRRGRAKLKDASRTHLAGIDELFVSRYSGSELATLSDLLSRLPMTGDDCKPSSCGV